MGDLSWQDGSSLAENSYKPSLNLITSFTVNENQIGPAVSEILRYKHTKIDIKTSCYFYISDITMLKWVSLQI